jgi:hypothetical protein
MIDIETLGKGPYAPIIALGAIHFDPNVVDGIISKFYVTIDPIESEKRGFRLDADTVMWWMQPKQREAWDQWTKTLHFGPDDALTGFAIWMDELDQNDPPYAKDEEQNEDRPFLHRALWGCGPGFDNEKLKMHYQVLNKPLPWDYGGDRCFRTFRNLPKASDCMPPSQGIAHKADDDALFQALWLQRILAAYNITA